MIVLGTNYFELFSPYVPIPTSVDLNKFDASGICLTEESIVPCLWDRQAPLLDSGGIAGDEASGHTPDDNAIYCDAAPGNGGLDDRLGCDP